ncbi:hypothetical protein ACQPXT_13595 [Streptomyces sp. CA-100214]
MSVANTTTEERPAAVYRLWDDEGHLLYIGSAYDPEERCKRHRGKPWWPLVARRTEEWHDSRAGAYGEELKQIRREEPPHNVMGTSRYVVPDTPGVRRRNALNTARARSKREAELRRGAVWDEAREAGVTGAEVSRIASLVYLATLEASGVWDPLVARLRAEHLQEYATV